MASTANVVCETQFNDAYEMDKLYNPYREELDKLALNYAWKFLREDSIDFPKFEMHKYMERPKCAPPVDASFLMMDYSNEYEAISRKFTQRYMDIIPETDETHLTGVTFYLYKGKKYFHDKILLALESYYRAEKHVKLWGCMSKVIITLHANKQKNNAIYLLLLGHMKDSRDYCILRTLPLEIIKMIIDFIKEDQSIGWTNIDGWDVNFMDYVDDNKRRKVE